MTLTTRLIQPSASRIVCALLILSLVLMDSTTPSILALLARSGQRVFQQKLQSASNQRQFDRRKVV
jgi:hypothetical protein